MAKNVDRSAATRGRLLTVARAQFARDGFAGTATEAILGEAGVKRGALYHHFRDKADLFEAVCREIAAEAVEAIRAAAADGMTAFDQLAAGSLAWFDAMMRPDARRILVIDAPAVLGFERWHAIDRENGFRLLLDGVRAAHGEGALRFDGPADALAVLLNGAMNGAVIHAGAVEGADAAVLRAGIVGLLAGLRPAEA
ncbi:TetR family transcriptional regulator [Phreatobacter sp.]|uniref:TetR family transcriptional regulator n=1 Tax=Phreatobacter sp. TaxID=1966341 RepID=UPI003F7083B3